MKRSATLYGVLAAATVASSLFAAAAPCVANADPYWHEHHRHWDPYRRVWVEEPAVVVAPAPGAVYVAPPPAPVYVAPAPAPVYVEPAAPSVNVVVPLRLH